jgi:hypothetical protein
LTGQSQPEISDILKGRQVMAYDLLARIADGLAIPRGLLGLAYDGQTDTDAAISYEPHFQGVTVPVPDRRDFLGLLAKVAVGAGLTTADLALLSAPAVATPAPVRVGKTEVDQLAELAHVLWAQEKRLGGGAVRDAAIAQLGWARSLLRGSHTDEVGRDLNVCLSEPAERSRAPAPRNGDAVELAHRIKPTKTA